MWFCCLGAHSKVVSSVVKSLIKAVHIAARNNAIALGVCD